MVRIIIFSKKCYNKSIWRFESHKACVAWPNKPTNPHCHISVTSAFPLNPKWKQKQVALPNKPTTPFLLIYIKYINIDVEREEEREREREREKKHSASSAK